jgi:hypothetical protein
MRLLVEDGRAILQTGATPFVMGVIRRLEGRRVWLKGGGLSIEPTGHNVSVLEAEIPGLEVVRPSEAAEDTAGFDLAAERTPYVEKTASHPHQVDCKAKARPRRHFAIFMEQGTGKSKVVVDLAAERFCAQEITGCLIISKKGVHRQWVEDQIPRHCGIPFAGAYWPIKTRDGWVPETLRPEPGILKFFTINIDGIKTEAGRKMAQSFITSHNGRVVMAIDESQDIKDNTSQRWKAAHILGLRCAHRIILTGTPIAKDLTDEWSQLLWLDESILGIRYKQAFRNEYCIMGGFEGREVVGQKNMARFRSLVDPHTFRVTKDEIGILPKAYDRWHFDLTATQKRMMREMRQTLVAKIDSGELATAANAMVAMLRLQQISNGFVQNDDKVVESIFPEPKANPRIAALLEYLDANPGKVAIWARFQRDIENIMSVLGSDAVAYYGPTKDRDRAEAVRSFLDPAGAKYFVSNPQAGGTGLNLQGLCQRAVYYSNSENSIDRWQSEDRIHRIGTNGACVYTDLVAKGSMDARILANHHDKKMLSNMSLGDMRNWLADDTGDADLFASINDNKEWPDD